MRNTLAATLLILGLATSAVPAFDIVVPPVTTADPGYLFPNDQYQRANQSGTAKPKELTLDAAAQRRVERAIAALVPEYNRRLARDGEQSANDWIRQKAFELGQQEADRMKQRLGRD